MAKIIVTQELLDNHPSLVKEGIVIGQIINISSDLSEITPQNNENLDDGYGEDPGGNNPPKKPIIP